MAYAVKLWFLLVLTLFRNKIIDAGPVCQQIPCYFVFGDSLADNGNNNNLKTEAKVNFLPYGIDFLDGPTGRFTNGRNFADVIGEFLGLKEYLPSFAASKGKNSLNGVNYASGGCGILPETGRNLGEVISFDEQLINHNTTVSHVSAALGGDKQKVANHLNKGIYIVGFGSNDYINNYLMPNLYPNSKKHTPDQYAQILINKYSTQLTTLYNYGARKIAVFGLGAIGCTPQASVSNKPNLLGCVDSTNKAVEHFNNKLKPLVEDLNRKHAGAHFIYVNVSNFSPEIGVLNKPCCKISENYGAGHCIPNHAPCHFRSFKSFFDGFHPTETRHVLLAGRAYVSKTAADAYPYDIRHLASI
ncbi:GDSL esterase/lipase [Heracleum sosnowskyi]|uniref:GDSL esterase/lipase n=1 Tax=Heracleum sosnowskyi TaxID=360622 RepID=A0AAD8I3Z2_9APIA|nr:GDSL esterase/lipase [Heracleum sosnowskyi]